jgi:hypothetical protein
MADESDPPRKFYGLKPTEFERVNAPSSASSPPPPPANLSPDPGPAAAADSSCAIDVRELARVASGGGSALGHHATVNRANDVHAILQHNLARANAAGVNKVTPPAPRKSRRQRDYFLSLLVGNVVLVVGTVINPVFGGAGLIIFNVGLAWVMWVVMDDY